MSYYGVSNDMYQVPPAGTPGWNLAPVPGWGTNPLRAGPPRIGVGCSVRLNDAVLPRYVPVGDDGYEGDKYVQYTLGHVSFAATGGIILGMLFHYLWTRHNERAK